MLIDAEHRRRFDNSHLILSEKFKFPRGAKRGRYEKLSHLVTYLVCCFHCAINTASSCFSTHLASPSSDCSYSW